MASPIVLDFEGFQLKADCFIIKELAFYSINEGHHACWSFLPPMPWETLSRFHQKSFAWVIRNKHHLSWNSGVLPYCALRYILHYLSSAYSTIYVKGTEKLSFLERLMNGNLRSLNCPKIKDLPLSVISIKCNLHSQQVHSCALLKANSYANYINKQLQARKIISIQNAFGEGCKITENSTEKSQEI